jgi:hypothetical protein
MTEPVRYVALRDRATGQFLVAGAGFVAGAGPALVLDWGRALDLVRRFSCEPDSLELVDVDELDLAVA